MTQVPQTTRWRPIETAPRDGRDFLAYELRYRGVIQEPYHAYYIAHWAEDPDPMEPNGWIDLNSDTWGASPTHWQPLEPPNAE